MSLCWLLINCSRVPTTKETVKAESVLKFTSHIVMFTENKFISFFCISEIFQRKVK